MPKTILIVDDSESIRTILKLTLKFKGYNVLEAEDGEKGYEILKKSECDLLISDVAMPKMTGTELLNKVRRELKNETLPIIICTAEKSANEEDFIARGANKLLKKPVSPNDLMKIVQNLVSP